MQHRSRPLVLRLIARLNVGGPARHAMWLTEGLRERFDSVLVTGVIPSGEQDFTDQARKFGIEPLIIPELSREIGWRDLVVIAKVLGLLRRLKPDLVHTHTAKAGAVGRVAGLLYRFIRPRNAARCVFVHTFHGHVLHGYYGRLKSFLFLLIERFLGWVATDRIVVISGQQLKELRDVYRIAPSGRFEVIPLGIELQDLLSGGNGSSFRKEVGAGDHTLIGIVGRLVEVKNHPLFLRAMSLLNSETDLGTKTPRAVIIGEGPRRAILEMQARDLGLDNVVFAGVRQPIESVYPALDLVALSSVNEGTPLALIEAMAAGVPVVSTRVGGVVDLVGEPVESIAPGVELCERGILVPSGDERAFAAALAFALRNPQRLALVAARARDFVQARYSRQRLICDVTALYERLLKER